MNTKSRSAETSSTRVKIGAAVLAAAEAVDTKSVAARLGAFGEAHRSYIDAERKVDDAEARLEAEKLKLAQLGADHDDAVEALARCLVFDGEPRGNPFLEFEIEAPSDIKRLGPAEAASTVRALIAAVERKKDLSQATRDALKQVEEATQKIETALVPVGTLRDELRAARRVCNIVGLRWNEALAALRRGARAAADEGHPGLYGELFSSSAKSPKKAKPVPAQPTAAVPAEPTAPVS